MRKMYSNLLFGLILVRYSHAMSDTRHVVVIVADDLGWNDVGFHGSDDILTPNIDALAYSGIILQNYYVLPICTPSRSALMTGLHPIHTGMQHRVIYASEPWGLPLDIKILPQYLKDEGYKTYAVGKWHLGHFKANYTPEFRGFDSHFGYWSGRQDYYDHTAQEATYWGYDMRRGLNVSSESYGHYTTDLLADESVNLIKSHDRTRPMFLYVAHLAVHSANVYQFLEAPKYVIDKFERIKDKNRRIFAAMLWKLDESVGKIVAALGQKGMLQDTLIVFTTDNGGAAAGFNSNAASNWPLKGVKDTLWEGGVRGSAALWSANLPSSRVNYDLMHIQDWLPTILNAVNEKQPSNEYTKLDGHNMWPVLKEEKSSIYDEIILNIDHIRNISALRKGDWKIISGEIYNGTWDGWYGPSGRDLKPTYDIEAVEGSKVAKTFKKQNISFPSRRRILEIRANVSISCKSNETSTGIGCNLKNERYCLYNVILDPCEQYNRAHEETYLLNDMISALKRYKPVTPLNQPSDPRSNPKFWNYTWTNWMDYV